MILDKFIAISLIAFSAISYRALKKVPYMDEALITIDEKAYGKISISANTTILDTLLKKDKTIIAIIERGHGTVRVVYSSCPDKICLHSGKIGRNGEKIICVPNKLVISIGKKDSECDAISE